MSIWKVLGGVAVGVAAVAAAPFTGGGSVAGAATLMGSLAGAGAAATAAGVVGGVAGAAMSNSDKKKGYKEGHAKGTQETKAEYTQKLSDLEQRCKNITERFKDYKQFEEFLQGLFAVGISVANCDGHIDDSELEEISKLVLGFSTTNLPKPLINRLEWLMDNPPSFKTAMLYLENFNQEQLDIVDSLIDSVIKADGVIDPHEIAYYQNWEKWYNQREFEEEEYFEEEQGEIIPFSDQATSYDHWLKLCSSNRYSPSSDEKWAVWDYFKKVS